MIVRPPEKDSGYFPDILVLNRANLGKETLWQKQSTLSLGCIDPFSNLRLCQPIGEMITI